MTLRNTTRRNHECAILGGIQRLRSGVTLTAYPYKEGWVIGVMWGGGRKEI